MWQYGIQSNGWNNLVLSSLKPLSNNTFCISGLIPLVYIYEENCLNNPYCICTFRHIYVLLTKINWGCLILCHLITAVLNQLDIVLYIRFRCDSTARQQTFINHEKMMWPVVSGIKQIYVYMTHRINLKSWFRNATIHQLHECHVAIDASIQYNV